MDLKEYQEKAKVTDCRPDNIKMICNGFGLIGELEEYKKEVQNASFEEADKELGDVLWYCSSICTYFGVSLQDVYLNYYKKFKYKKPIAEVFKKVYRDKNGQFDEEDKQYILSFISHNVLNYSSCYLNEVARKNIEKLYSRKERGVIQGNGSNR